MKTKMIALLACLVTAQAFAEDVPRSTCEKPIQPNRQASDMVVKSFNKHVAAYKACIQKFVDEHRALSISATDPEKARQENDAAEAAMVEFNTVMAEMKARSSADEE